MKSVVRAIRLTEELDEDLRTEAESKGITVASLVSSILTRYTTVERQSQALGIVNLHLVKLKLPPKF